ncbi:hypothetical protein [Myroides marinus]|uniref:hypothetical protein n=1 Tax=Myroides marinus TaxID=703342 RepID=UPI002575F6D0|nr:hypothetical protein [Myroides marinus]
MKNFKASLLTVLTLSMVLLLTTSTFAQIKVGFKPRQSTKAPIPYTNVKNYKVQGDFLMLGNTSMTLVNYALEKDNSSNLMRYVDVDNDRNTVNSSSADLVLPGGDCTEIVYAGLYWSGRAHNGGSSAQTFTVKNTVTEERNDGDLRVTGNNYNNYGIKLTKSREGSSRNYYTRYQIDFKETITTIDFTPDGVFLWENRNWRVLPAWITNPDRTTKSAQLQQPLVIRSGSSTLTIKTLFSNSATNGRESSYTNNNNYIIMDFSGEIEVEKDKLLDKRKVKLKKGTNAYINVEASSSDIYYPSDKDGNMYSAYADITDYVRQNGAGSYTVADLAVIEGNGGGTGFYGGWGMVIIYKNAAMKWRDITVFDGHAYVAGGTYKYELPISGFKASQYGNVNVTLGMMAGEGDRKITGDYFEIKRGNNYDRLSHEGNTTDNFFNSSIQVGGTSRNPDLVNNTGFDIAKFDLDNSNNKYIGNNATNATFRYGSTQDTYVIYNIVFAVDAYVPEIIGENKAMAVDGMTPTNNGTINPGQKFGFELDVFNKGTEAVNNSKIEIPVPANLHFAGADVQGGFPAGGSVKWIPPTGGTNDPTKTAGGTIVWDIGKLPLDQKADKNTILAKLKYYFKVSDNCVLLSTNVCGLEVRINGKISGVGATSQEKVGSDLVRDYGSGACAGPVYDDFMSTITLGVDFLQNCNPPVEDGVMQFKAFCSVPANGFNRAEIVSTYPQGTKFYSTVPTSYSSNDGLVNGNFPVNANGSKKMYYVMTPDMKDGCYARLEISVDKVVTEPTVKNVEICYGETITLENKLSATGVTNQYQLIYFDSNKRQIDGVPNPTEVGTHKYFVAEGKDGCFGSQKEFTITITALPTVSKDLKDIVICENFDSSTITVTTNAVNYNWEYTTTGTTKWNKLDNTSFSNVVILQGKSIRVSHATKAIDGIRIRLNVDNGSCSDVSNEFEIKVEDCSAVTNPMLLNQGMTN